LASNFNEMSLKVAIFFLIFNFVDWFLLFVFLDECNQEEHRRVKEQIR
jgi:hypothetical protein